MFSSNSTIYTKSYFKQYKQSPTIVDNNFAPPPLGSSTCELDETYASSLILAHSRHYAKTCIPYHAYDPQTVSSEEDRATATGNMHRKFGEIWTCGFEICEWTDKQTNTQTDKHDDYNTSPTYRKQVTIPVNNAP